MRFLGLLMELIISMMLLPSSAFASAPAPHVSTAFFYAPHPPPALFAHFDRVVVEPDHFDRVPPSPRAEPFAYVSVGEVHPTRPWRKDIPAALVRSHDPVTGNDLVDTRDPAWSTFLLDRVVEPLWSRGFRGFFLDTLDSYERITDDAGERRKHADGIARLIEDLKRRHPDAKILVNRGFDVLPGLKVPVDGLVVESLVHRGTDRAELVSLAEQAALRSRIEAARATRPLPVTIIDYVPSTQPDERRRTARQILALGFDPWVTAPSLDEVGVGAVEILPRRVLLLYKSAADQTKSEGSLAVHDAAVLIAPVLEHLGYVVDYLDVRRPLPADNFVGQVAGVVALVPEHVDDELGYRAFIERQIRRGIRVAFVEGFGADFGAALLAELGLRPPPSSVHGTLRVTETTSYFGFEAPPRVHLHDLPAAQIAPGSPARSLLRLTDEAGGTWDAGVLAPWGGVVFSAYVIEEGLESERRFVLDPYTFLRDALALPPIPAPDVTTESGRRVITVHIDGDGFVSRAERSGAPYNGEVILKQILTRYTTLPHTVSVIEGEIGPAGLYPKESPRLEEIAREMFRLPHVEIGSHTYSHPFEWEEAEAGKKGTATQPSRLFPEGYQFDLDREIRGSIEYIDTRLAPPGKKTRIMLWSGSCTPSAAAVEKAQAAGVWNVNGGGATRTKAHPSLTRGSAVGIPKAPGVFQVFAPVENENVFTNDWTGPYYGFRTAIETFELTDSPRRTGPITIYYHHYSAAKEASLVALHQVYAWALTQETTPLYLSEYAETVNAFERVTLARRLEGGDFEVGYSEGLRTLRLDAALGFPDLDRSTGIAGVRDLPQGRYLHLAPPPSPAQPATRVLALTAKAPAVPYVLHSNGRIETLRRQGSKLRLKVAARAGALQITIGGATTCSLSAGGPSGVKVSGSPPRVVSTSADPGEIALECR